MAALIHTTMPESPDVATTQQSIDSTTVDLADITTPEG
jgi:hypothetical protein